MSTTTPTASPRADDGSTLLIGLLTPGHVGADVWRVTRLHGTGMGHGDAVLSVG